MGDGEHEESVPDHLVDGSAHPERTSITIKFKLAVFPTAEEPEIGATRI